MMSRELLVQEFLHFADLFTPTQSKRRRRPPGQCKAILNSEYFGIFFSVYCNHRG